ncbi:alpha-amylase family glycosyl hydrolase [Tropicimonas sp. S265A]|uniref:alpha-amylase family glycosyl hydrolase n=1 Tax=Tropicimonas sp. S265A TaxID=3415134 RepID=UPI003C7CF02D
MADIRQVEALASDPDWWRGAVIYQIYPRSFQDANGDGIGDLLGIVERMPYIASLGVDAIWISPFFTSPMKDFGYDVSDYCDVDPMFGSLADFDVLVETAHALGLRVMIDLVLSHTSDQHPWFAESRASRDNPKADWYVWADPKPDGTPPNNWLSIFGGSGWHWDARREQYYLHNFLTSQPDLNFHCEAVQDALLDVARFWLGRGVDGFRLDTINFYTHDAQLRDNPPLPPEERNATIAPSVNPYNHQMHLYSKNQPENLEFLAKFRAVMEEFDSIAAVGEVGDAQRGLEILGDYTTGDQGVHMCYAFEFLAKDKLTAARVAEVLGKVAEVAADGWACWAFSNHDVMRHVTRWGLTPAAQRALVTLIVSLRGSVCLYQGEELGLTEADVALEDLQDPYGIEFWPEYKGRDGCRTPMVWQTDNLHGGFSKVRPWLPVSTDHLHHSVDAQEAMPEALLHHYRRAIAFRKAQPALAKGALEDLSVQGDVLRFRRVYNGVEVFFALNMSEAPGLTDLPAGRWLHIGAELNSAGAGPDGRVHLGPWQPAIAIKA